MKRQKRLIIALILLGTVFIAAQFTSAESLKGYYRYPALHGDLIVFAAEGDLWTVSASGERPSA